MSNETPLKSLTSFLKKTFHGKKKDKKSYGSWKSMLRKYLRHKERKGGNHWGWPFGVQISFKMFRNSKKSFYFKEKKVFNFNTFLKKILP